MNAMSHVFDLSHATMLPPLPAEQPAHLQLGALAAQWEAVHQAAMAVAQLAQLGSEEAGESIRQLPLRAARHDSWRYAMIVNAVDDLAAVMQPGLRALLALTARGKDTTTAALTLWREFRNSRDAILALTD